VRPERDPRVYLPEQEVRCVTDRCKRAAQCARALALIGSSPVEDYTTTGPTVGIGDWCIRFVSVSAAKAMRPVVTPPVKDFPRC
jgi:hypothetical protein